MGHRHFYSASPMFESDPDQNWNHMHTQQHYMHPGRSGTSDSGSFCHPLENMSTDSISFPPHWNSAARSNIYASSSVNTEALRHQSYASGTSHNHFLHSSSAGTSFEVSGNYASQPSNSNYQRQSFPDVDGGFIDRTLTSGWGSHKRKGPGVPSIYESGSTSRHVNARSASDLPSSSESRLEKPYMDSQYMPWDHVSTTPSFRGSGLPIRGEGSSRNVRRQRTQLWSNSPHNSYPTGMPVNHSRPVDLSSQTSSNWKRDWCQMSINPAHGRVLPSDSSAFFSHETSHFLVGRHSSNAPVGVDHNDFGTRRNPPAPQFFQNNLTQTTWGVHGNYSQRPITAFSASSSFCFGHAAPSEDGLHILAESDSAVDPWPLSSVGWQSSDRNGPRMYSDRYHSLSDEAGRNDRFFREYGSPNIHDQHRDMRMDIDNMSYEVIIFVSCVIINNIAF